MNNEHLRTTLRLLKRTGDRGIVLDNDSDSVFVLMDTDAYEEMLDQIDLLEIDDELSDEEDWGNFDDWKTPASPVSPVCDSEVDGYDGNDETSRSRATGENDVSSFEPKQLDQLSQFDHFDLSEDDEMKDYVLDDYIEMEEKRGQDENDEDDKIDVNEGGRKQLNQLHQLDQFDHSSSRPVKEKFEKIEFGDEWAGAKNSIVSNEVSLADVPHDEDEEEEEKFYLEPIE